MSEQQPTIFGIDLGTTYSCIAYVDQYGKASTVVNAEGDITTPSVVLFEGSNRVVGKEAKNVAMLHPDTTVEMVKRHMGERDWRFEYESKEYTAEEISSYILRKLANDAATQLGRDVTDVVITCPAYFGLAEREATANAGKIAGLNVRAIINEPTAAAIDFGLQNEGDRMVMVYDLGGGTFDVTIIRIESGAITVVATGGDHRLGGRDWDEQIVRYLSQQWQIETGSADDPLDDPATLQDLWQKAESNKRTLSARTETKIPVIFDNKPAQITLTRQKFDELTGNLLEQTIAYTRSTLETARVLGVTAIDQLLLVGGSTRMPQVKARLMQEFNIEPRVHDPDQAVAKGAAIYGQKLAIGDAVRVVIAGWNNTTPEQVDTTTVDPQTLDKAQDDVAAQMGLLPAAVKGLDNLIVRNVASHSFGVIALDSTGTRETISNLVLKNQQVPAERTRQYGTVQPFQETVLIRIVENDLNVETEPDVSKGREIGQATLELPPGLPARSRIDVTFVLDEQGRLHITAREPSGNRVVEATVQTEGVLSEPEMAEARARTSQLVVV